jgi:hypothetical protein
MDDFVNGMITVLIYLQGLHMNFDPEKHHRQSIRLKEYDYSQSGAYYVTICTKNRECLFGNVEAGKMVMNDAGRMVDLWWNKLPEKYESVHTDIHAVMPNHFHGILIINHHVGAIPCNRPLSKLCNRPILKPFILWI